MFEMAEKIIWLAALLLVYTLFCLVCGFRGARAGKQAGSIFFVDGTVSTWSSASALTAAALGAWVMLTYPGQIYSGGLPAANLSAVAIALPFCALLLYGRLSALGLRTGQTSIANLLGDYFQSTPVRALVILAGFGFALPLLALQFHIAGALLNTLSNDTISITASMLALAGLVTLYTAWGGIRAVVSAAKAQYGLMALGLVLLGIVALYYIGGVTKLSTGLAALAEIDANRTPAGSSHYLAIPGVLQWVSSAREALGSPWTGAMMATSVIAFTGLITSPVIVGWSLGVQTSKPAAHSMILSSAVLLGLLLLVFSVVQGLGGHLLGGNMAMSEERGDFVYNVMGANLAGMDLMETVGQEYELIPVLIHLMGDTLPWLFALLTVCALAALHASSSAVLVGASTLLTLAFGADGPSTSRRLLAAGATAFLSACALAMAWQQESPSFHLAHLSLAIGAQMWPALLGICWFARITGPAAAAGMAAGIIAAFATDPLGVDVLGLQAWGGWPLTVHSAVWGLLANVVVVALVSALSSWPPSLAHRLTYHQDRRESVRDAGLAGSFPLMAVTLFGVWLIFASGPGAVVGNSLFGPPDAPDQWLFAIPSLWVWHGLWWALGVVLLVYVARSLNNGR